MADLAEGISRLGIGSCKILLTSRKGIRMAEIYAL